MKRLLPLREMAEILGLLSERLGIHRPRTKFLDVEKANLAYHKQRNHFKSGNPMESIPNRIVSVSKPYVRPIVRGKEAKNVEFGAKCNNIMVDGLSFIEKLSFNAFNEGTRLLHCVKKHKRLFGVDVKKVGSDHFLRDSHRQCGATRRADDGTAEGESCLKGRL